MTMQQTQQTHSDSILPRDVSGLMYITGLRGVGKSYLAAQADRPSLVCFLDFDDGKGRAIHEQLHFGMYRDVNAELTQELGAQWKAPQMYQKLQKVIAEIPTGQFTICVLDNIDYIESSLGAEVRRDPDSYNIGKNKNGTSHAVTGSFGGVTPGVNHLIGGIVSTLHGKGMILVVAIAHVKAAWGSSGQIPNKWRPRGVERWQQMSILSVVVVPGKPNALPPAAIVQKEALGKIKFNEFTGEFDMPSRRLPLRLPVATFAEIRRYLREPANIGSPKELERPIAEETDPFSDKFSNEQLKYMTVAAELALREEESASLIALKPVAATIAFDVDKAKSMLAELNGDPSALPRVAEAMGVGIPDLIKAGVL